MAEKVNWMPALQIRDSLGIPDIPFIGLAKKDEQIVIKNLTVNNNEMSVLINENKLAELGGNLEITDDFILINLPKSTPIIKLLQRIRDESHRFAVSYHTVLKRTRQTMSILDEIGGIGPKTRTKLIRKFGSVAALKNLSIEELAKVVGRSKAEVILSNIK